MSLREYKRKRHFRRTPEPKGKKAAAKGYSYVIQKHAARRLHYDFRLEMDGVLKSWAVPKGPSLDPGVKRLAVHVEDHPLAYGSFEGTIPAGEYGAGTVERWDHGTWEPIGDPHEGYTEGKLKFILHGKKLHGGWTLVWIGRRAEAEKDRNQWLLIKERDDAAKPSRNGQSVKSPAAKAARMPTRIDAQLATLTAEAPDGDEWLHEIKYDGYRIFCRIDGDDIALLSRNHKSWTDRFSFLVDAAKSLTVKQAILDGEVVAMRPDGVSDFQQLQNSFRNSSTARLYYYVFDLLYLDGRDLTPLPLEERKRLLANLLEKKGISNRIRLSEHIVSGGPAMFREACKMGMEGIISKRRDRPYAPGRGLDWVKVKCKLTEELVIGGYTDPGGSRLRLGALLLGYHNSKGELVYAGKVGTGFGDRTLTDLENRLHHLKRSKSPFKRHKATPAGAHWVDPKLVAQVTFAAWTQDGLLRQASFQGLREDKPAGEVTRDKPKPIEAAESMSARTSPSRKSESNGYDPRTQQFAGVRLTSPDKVLYPEEGITKLELAEYFRDIADWMLPHVADRALALVRCPEGREGECFFQKHPGIGTPGTLRQVSVRETSKREPYVVVDDVAGLVSLAQIGALEVHAWGSHAGNIEKPDRLTLDLDPGPRVPWENVVQSAKQLRDLLNNLGLVSFVKTTGGKGLHVVIPIEPRHTWDEAKDFCKQIAELIVSIDPAHFTANLSKAARPGRIFIDYLRNGRGATAVVAYSPRARPGAPVSTPLTWKELTPRMHSDQYNVRNILKHLKSIKRDAWQGMESVHQDLTEAIRKLAAMTASR